MHADQHRFNVGAAEGFDTRGQCRANAVCVTAVNMNGHNLFGDKPRICKTLHLGGAAATQAPGFNSLLHPSTKRAGGSRYFEVLGNQHDQDIGACQAGGVKR